MINLKFGNSGRRHVRIANGLYFFNAKLRSKAIETQKYPAQKIDGPFGWIGLAKCCKSDEITKKNCYLGNMIRDEGLAITHPIDDTLRKNVEEQGLGSSLFPLQIHNELFLSIAQPFLFQAGADSRPQ